MMTKREQHRIRRELLDKIRKRFAELDGRPAERAYWLGAEYAVLRTHANITTEDEWKAHLEAAAAVGVKLDPSVTKP